MSRPWCRRRPRDEAQAAGDEFVGHHGHRDHQETIEEVIDRHGENAELEVVVVVVPHDLVGDVLHLSIEWGVLPEPEPGQDPVGEDERHEQGEVGEPQAVVPFPDGGPARGREGQAGRQQGGQGTGDGDVPPVEVGHTQAGAEDGEQGAGRDGHGPSDGTRDVVLQRLIGEQAGVRDAEEEEPLLQRNARDPEAAEVIGIEPPDALLSERNIPRNKEGHHNGNGRKEGWPEPSKPHLAVKTERQWYGQNGQVHSEVSVMRIHAALEFLANCAFRACRKYSRGTHSMPKHSPSSLLRCLWCTLWAFRMAAK